jgi:hypothetical protein
MRPLVAGLFVVLGCGFLGCASVTPDISPSAGETIRPSLFDAEKDPNTLFIDSALIERPAEDLYCTETIWESCDEQFVGLEQLAQFERNGWRVGRLTAPLPSKLQNLLNSKRSCSGPRRQRARAEEPLRVALGGVRSSRVVEVQGKETRRLELTNALGQLEVLPRLEDESLFVRLTPALIHGQSRPRHAVEESPEGSLRWALDVRDPTENFPELGFEISLQAGEYLLIGPRGEDRYSVGHALLTEKQDDQLVSRWLLLRAVRPRGGDSPTPDSKSAPLALQAGYSTARGSSR